MNDKTSAIVILEGSWEFFRDKDFENTLGTLDPGLYPNKDQLGPKPNDNISSLRPVNVLGGVLKSKEGVLESKRGTPVTK